MPLVATWLSMIRVQEQDPEWAEPQPDFVTSQPARSHWYGLLVVDGIMFAILVAGVGGAAVGLGLQAWGCTASDTHHLRAWTVFLTVVIAAFCVGCALFLYRIGARRPHVVLWMMLAMAVIGVGAWYAVEAVNFCT